MPLDRLRSLHLFRQEAGLGSFSAAAREAGVPQSSISRAIAELEGELGVKLLNRTTRRVGLTPQGRRYLERVDEGFRHLDEADALVRTGLAELDGEVKVCLSGVIGRRLVAPRLLRALREHPALRIVLAFSEGLSVLSERGFDFAIRVSGSAPDGFVAEPIAESPQCVVASPATAASRCCCAASAAASP